MERKSKILTTAVILIVAASVYATYERYLVKKDFSYYTDEALFQEALLVEE